MSTNDKFFLLLLTVCLVAMATALIRQVVRYFRDREDRRSKEAFKKNQILTVNELRGEEAVESGAAFKLPPERTDPYPGEARQIRLECLRIVHRHGYPRRDTLYAAAELEDFAVNGGQLVEKIADLERELREILDRDRNIFFEHVRGYKIGDMLYDKDDVQIVMDTFTL
jgi:hypothetical protein